MAMNTARAIRSCLLVSCILIGLSLPAETRAQSQPLRASADVRGVYIGSAVAVTPFRNEQIYQDTLRREFNIMVAENAFKWDSVHPARDTYNFSDTDALVDFAQANHMKMRGHTLVWHNQIPAWLTGGGFSRDEVIAILKDHISTLVGRYKGRVWAWDVVNEAIDDSTHQLRTSSFWYQSIGPDYVKMAFELAHEADPDALLYYNDYSIEGLNPKSDAVYNMLKDLKNQGEPIDGVGWQTHVVNGFRIQPQHQTNAMRFASIGLDISITEMDVRINLPDSPAAQQQQALAYSDVINLCLNQPNCKALVMWGFTDKYSWIPGAVPGWGDALIYDSNYQAKPAYFSLQTVLEQGLDLSPKISAASRNGKQLIITGQLFEDGAELLINGEKQNKVSNDSQSPATTIVARKAGKIVRLGDILQIKNPDGLLSNQFTYTG
jgi:endo-1,4-beta-xylanase